MLIIASTEVGTAYRVAARALFAPFGGLRRIRHAALDALALGPEVRVLELGCGPGEVTASLIARGARVEAVDASAGMVASAARRAPAARYVQADLREYTPSGAFDAVLVMFVLHELPEGDIAPLIERAASALVPGGRMVIVDHAVPAGAGGAIWRRVLHIVESRSIDRWLAVRPAAVMRAAGLIIEAEDSLAGGRVLLARARR